MRWKRKTDISVWHAYGSADPDEISYNEKIELVKVADLIAIKTILVTGRGSL
jgi:hypothetical protein